MHRYQQRGGYRNQDDPGLVLKIQHPHVLKALSQNNFCDLSIGKNHTTLLHVNTNLPFDIFPWVKIY